MVSIEPKKKPQVNFYDEQEKAVLEE